MCTLATVSIVKLGNEKIILVLHRYVDNSKVGLHKKINTYRKKSL